MAMTAADRKELKRRARRVLLHLRDHAQVAADVLRELRCQPGEQRLEELHGLVSDLECLHPGVEYEGEEPRPAA